MDTEGKLASVCSLNDRLDKLASWLQITSLVLGRLPQLGAWLMVVLKVLLNQSPDSRHTLVSSGSYLNVCCPMLAPSQHFVVKCA